MPGFPILSHFRCHGGGRRQRAHPFQSFFAQVLAEGTGLLAAATNVLRFFRDESCGKCVPCRAGSAKAHRILTELLASGGGPGDVDERVSQLEETMRRTSICGLGQVALGPVMSVVRLNGRGNDHGG